MYDWLQKKKCCPGSPPSHTWEVVSLTTAVAREDRPIVRVEDGKAIYRASAAGYCRRALYLARLGYDPLPEPDHLLRAAREGKRHECWVIEDLEAEGIEVRDRQAPVTLDHGVFAIEGTIDGRVVVDRRRVLEVKSMSRNRFGEWRRRGFGSFPEYAAQGSVYMEATGDPLYYVVKCRDDGAVDRRAVDEHPVPYAEVRARITAVEVAVRRSVVPPEECDDRDYARLVCRWRYFCGDWVTERVEAGELTQLAEQWRAAKALMDQAEELMEESRKAFEAYLRANGLERLVVSGLAVALVRTVRHSVALDALKKALKKHAPEAKDAVLAECVKETASEYVRVVEEKEG